MLLGYTMYIEAVGSLKVLSMMKKLNSEFFSLQQEVEDYRFLFETSDAAMLILDASGNYLDYNIAYRRMLGFPQKGQLKGFQVGNVSPPRQADGRKSSEKAYAMIRVALENGRHEFEWLHKDAVGHQFFSNIVLDRIYYKGEIALRATIYDISDLKDAESMVQRANQKLAQKNEALEVSRNELEFMFEHCQVGMAVVSSERKITRFNRRFLQIFGYDHAKELLGQSTKVIHVSNQNFNEFGALYQSKQLDGSVLQLQYQFRRKDGSIFWGTLSGIAINPEETPSLGDGVLWVLDDITYQKEMEKELKALYRSALDANPMTGLPGNNSIMKRIKQAIIDEEQSCVVYVDLDNFKAYNDHYGFCVGG